MKTNDLELIADVKRQKLGKLKGWEALKDKLSISYQDFALLYNNIGYSEQEFYEAEDLKELMGVDRQWIVSQKELHPLCIGDSVFVGSKSLRRFILEFPGEIIPYQMCLDFLWFVSIIDPIVGG